MRLSKKELKRACASDQRDRHGITIAVRPQAGNRGYSVSLVDAQGKSSAAYVIVKTRGAVRKAVEEMLDMHDRLGNDCDMAYASSHRRKR